MFKKTVRVATAFGVLLAGYAAYVHVFALVARGFDTTTTRRVVRVGAPQDSRTARAARDLARRGFGPDHWAAADDLPIRIYNADRGFWMFARDYERLNDGKRLKFTPFAVIWMDRDGRGVKTATSDSATVDLDQPLGLIAQPGASGGVKVLHARMEGNVALRDDKGTPDPADDLRISRLTYLEYDEPGLQIASESEILIEDGGYRITGRDLLIELRPREPQDAPAPRGGVGFNGAKTAFLRRDVHITIRDVGPSGILPGGNAAAATPAAAGAAAAREPTPLELFADRQMQIDLPRPRAAVVVGPPAPQGPTVAQFYQNVEVLRGRPDRPRDQLTCDYLRLTLVPADRPPAAPAGGPAAPAGETASNLTLKRAEASGHNVRLVSAGQGIKARCNELIHKKLLPERPDETYLRGDATTRLIVEKEDTATEGPDRGKVVGSTLIRTIDATIFDDGKGNENATIVARGPGDLEFRPGRDRPVERTARWDDQLTMQTELGPAPRPGAARVALKRLTLTGRPGFADVPAQASLDARQKLVVWLAPKPRPPAPAGPAAGNDPGKAAGGAFDIQKLVALGDVKLRSPGKTLTARDRLDAEFDGDVAPASVVVDARPAGTAAAAPAGAAPAAPAAANPAAPAEPAKPAAAGRPAEPEARAVANRVWAKIRLRPAPAGAVAAANPAPAAGAGAGAGASAGGGGLFSGGGRRAEIDRVYLRGGVNFHEDPPAGKVKGTDVVGEAVDLISTGENSVRFLVFDHDPTANPGATAPAPAPVASPADAFDQVIAEAAGLDATLARLARVETDEMTIRGRVIGLDQAIDQAWVDGRGSLTRMAGPGLLSDRGQTAQEKEKGKPKEKDRDPKKAPGADRGKKGGGAAGPEAKPSPLTVTFARGMKFFGRSTDPSNRPAARAEFYDDVHAWTDDASLDCSEVMRLYLDRTVKLARPGGPNAPRAPGAAEDDKADVALIECVKQVVAVNLKRDPATGDLVQKQRIVGDSLTYEKATGKFVVPGEGEVFLYEREGQNGPAGLNGVGGGGGGNANPGAGNGGRAIRPTSFAGRDLDAGADAEAPAARAPAAVGRNAVGGPADVADRVRAGVRAAVPNRAKARAVPPLVLTQIHFTTEMHGRFGTGRATDTTETRWADFFGDVEVLRAKVANALSVLDPDDRPADALFMTAQTLRVVSEPTRDPKNAAPPPRYLLRAWENAYAASEDKVIQADTITYDSLFKVLYAYGDDGRDVLIAQQAAFGVPATVTQGRAARYNTADGQSELIDPKSVAFVNIATGIRPTTVGPPKDKTKVKRPPRLQFRNLRGNIERKDFTGR